MKIDITKEADARSFLCAFLMGTISENLVGPEATWTPDELRACCDIEMTINGKPADPIRYVRSLEERLDKMVEERAQAIVKERCGAVIDRIYRIELELETMVEDGRR